MIQIIQKAKKYGFPHDNHAVHIGRRVFSRSNIRPQVEVMFDSEYTPQELARMKKNYNCAGLGNDGMQLKGIHTSEYLDKEIFGKFDPKQQFWSYNQKADYKGEPKIPAFLIKQMEKQSREGNEPKKNF